MQFTTNFPDTTRTIQATNHSLLCQIAIMHHMVIWSNRAKSVHYTDDQNTASHSYNGTFKYADCGVIPRRNYLNNSLPLILTIQRVGGFGMNHGIGSLNVWHSSNSVDVIGHHITHGYDHETKSVWRCDFKWNFPGTFFLSLLVTILSNQFTSEPARWRLFPPPPPWIMRLVICILNQLINVEHSQGGSHSSQSPTLIQDL